MNPPQWPADYAVCDAALLMLLAEVMKQSIFDSTAQFLLPQPRQPKRGRWQHKNEFVFQNPPASLKASESLLTSHSREIRCTQNSAAGWLGMLIVKLYPVFIRQEPKELAL